MTLKPKRSKGDIEEYKRFLETAKQVEASEKADAFDEAFRKVVKPIPAPKPQDQET